MRQTWSRTEGCGDRPKSLYAFLRQRGGSTSAEHALLLSLIGGGILAGAIALGAALVDGLSAPATRYLGASDSHTMLPSGGSGGGQSASTDAGSGNPSGGSSNAGSSAQQDTGESSGANDGTSGIGDQTGRRTYGGQDEPGDRREQACANGSARNPFCGE